MGEELDRMYVNGWGLDAARCRASGKCVSAAVSLFKATREIRAFFPHSSSTERVGEED